LLIKDAKNDPIKKADLIRDMVVSISKIPDRIKREIYIQECSRIMDISEQVLLNTLAQLIQKEIIESGKKTSQDQKAFEVVKKEKPLSLEKVDIVNRLERSILGILLLYGNYEIEFQNVFVNFDEHGKEYEQIEKVRSKIFQHIYLNLQEDEIEFSNPLFKAIYDDLLKHYLQGDNFDKTIYLSQLNPEYSQLVTDLFMDDEKHHLHAWFDKKQVFVKEKTTKKFYYV